MAALRTQIRDSRAARRRLSDAVDRIRALLTAGWEISVARRFRAGGELQVRSISGSTGDLVLINQTEVTPRDVPSLPRFDKPSLVTARWLSPRTRELLRERGFGFLDSTGNAEIALPEPGPYIRTDGAARDPQPKPSASPGMRGPRVWALLRTLIEVALPYGVTELSRALDLDTGYVSRVLRVLTDEMIIEHTPRGPVTDLH